MARKVAPKAQVQFGKRRQDWIMRVTSLADQVENWSKAEGWTVQRHQKQITEDRLGTYSVPQIVVRLEGGELMLTPIALETIGGNGRVDLEAIPTLARVKIVGDNGGWKLLADPNVPLRVKWDRPSFVELAHDLLS